MNPALKRTAHILLYVLALATLWAAMGLGLQYHITVGPFNVATILLFAAPAIAARQHALDFLAQAASEIKANSTENPFPPQGRACAPLLFAGQIPEYGSKGLRAAPAHHSGLTHQSERLLPPKSPRSQPMIPPPPDGRASPRARGRRAPSAPLPRRKARAPGRGRRPPCTPGRRSSSPFPGTRCARPADSQCLLPSGIPGLSLRPLPLPRFHVCGLSRRSAQSEGIGNHGDRAEGHCHGSQHRIQETLLPEEELQRPRHASHGLKHRV